MSADRGRRLDQALVDRGLARSRSRASDLVAEGHVRLNGAVARKAATPVGPQDVLEVIAAPAWVSRAALKLVGALDEVDPGGALFAAGPVVLDAGASTGGFTQVCLARGASLVHAIDVGHDQLDPALRADPRVRVVEGFNLRDLTPEHLPGAVDLVVCDVSFISLRLLLGPLLSVLRPEGVALLMVKPQFEVGRDRLGPGGVVADPDLRREAVDAVLSEARALGWMALARRPAVITGAHGNQEYFVLLARRDGSSDPVGAHR